MTDRSVKRCAAVGLAVVSVLAVLTMSIGGLHLFRHTYALAADFADASGVSSGDPVRVAGIDVGSVSRVVRLSANTVRVELQMDHTTKVSRESRASIRLRTLLGARYVSLDDPGQGPPAPPGFVIPRERTQVPAELDTTLDALNNVAKPLDVGSLNKLIEEFGNGLDGHTGEVNAMLGDLAHLSAVMAARAGDINTLIAATDRLSAALADRRQALAVGIDSFATILNTLADRRVELSQLVSGVQALSARLTPLLRDNQGTLDATLGDLLTTAKVLDAQRSRLDLSMQQLPILAQRFTRITGEGSWINVYFVGTVITPYAMNPVNLGDNQSMDPAKDGGLPRLNVSPPPVPGASAGGTQVNTGDDRPPPPQGYPG